MRYVVRDEEAQTGLALMLVNSDGRYVCYVSIGANYRLSVDDVRRALDAERFDMLIEVDGNVSFENAVKMHAAGADVYVAGSSSVFAPGATLEENMRRFRAIIDK